MDACPHAELIYRSNHCKQLYRFAPTSQCGSTMDNGLDLLHRDFRFCIRPTVITPDHSYRWPVLIGTIVDVFHEYFENES
jgi:hypothetical protein